MARAQQQIIIMIRRETPATKREEFHDDVRKRIPSIGDRQD
jgi:hypothetical protein